MKCETCGQEIKTTKDPWSYYRVVGGRIETKLIHPDAVPAGWYESHKIAVMTTYFAEPFLAKPVEQAKLTEITSRQKDQAIRAKDVVKANTKEKPKRGRPPKQKAA